MEEPKRRARRAQLPADAQTGPEAKPADSLPADAPKHRRRAQQAAVDDQPCMPQAERKKTKSLWKRAYRLLSQAALGMAVLLGVTGRALVSAVRRIRKEQMRLLAMALCACVALFSAWQIGGIVLRSVRTNRLNESLSRQRAALIETQEDTGAQLIALAPTAEPTAAPAAQPDMKPDTAADTEADQTGAARTPAAAAPKADVVKSTKYRQVGGDALPEMAQLHQQNHDLVAWLQIPDVLDLPVVYRDNSYYLTRDFSKQKNASGTIFLDENHPFKEKTQNLLLHGHNMKDGTMFGRLAQYLYDDTYLRNHPIIYFDTLWNKEQYVIVAVLNVSLKPGDARFFNYFTHDTFSSDTEFETYIRQLQLRSRYAIPIDVNPSDALLTLSTCLDEDRLVIVCRRLRENETRSELRTLIRMATRQ